MKGNQPTLRAQLAGLPWRQILMGHRSSGNAHGRRREMSTLKVVTIAVRSRSCMPHRPSDTASCPLRIPTRAERMPGTAETRGLRSLQARLLINFDDAMCCSRPLTWENVLWA
jgi:hypothetical protein